MVLGGLELMRRYTIERQRLLERSIHVYILAHCVFIYYTVASPTLLLTQVSHARSTGTMVHYLYNLVTCES